MIVLSICIPSYNRFYNLEKCVHSVLSSKSNEFEIVIVDNQSPKNINETLNFYDSRLRIVNRTESVDGKLNVGNCVYYSKGKYTMLCLDKDRVDGRYIDEFIEALKSDDSICGG